MSARPRFARIEGLGLRRTLGWIVVAIVVAASGGVLSVVLAGDQASTDEFAADQAFERHATDITNTLTRALQRESDLVVSTGALYAGNPSLSTSDLASWLRSINARERHPELIALAVMRVVPRAELSAFTDRLRDDPAFDLGPEAELTIAPPGERSSYCLLQAVVEVNVPTPGEVTVPGIDYCATDVGPLLTGARDAGTPSYLAVPNPAGTQLVVQAPIYAGGQDPGTVEGRRASYLGNLGTAIDPAVLFDSVLSETPDTVITLSFGASSSTSFTSGDAIPGARVVHRDLGNGWSVTIAQPGWATGLWASSNAVQLLAVGWAASLALGVLILVLGTGRQRAMRLVASRTEQLNHQALHDALTDLPNRALILDRTEQLLARCSRNGTVGAALFVDLDGFKVVNDSLGHEAGDQLLRIVASRLTTSLRDVDTIGRMGGDEFVVLVDGATLQIAPELVAQRLLDVLREPIELDLAARPVVVSASVGIASGARTTASDLLRDADIALYRAKESGRNCFEVFRPEMETAVQHQYELESDLRTALHDSEFRLYFQPIYDLSDLTVIGAEALIRWEHPTKGLLAASEFIPMLEASGQIVEVGRWVIEEACRQASTWRGAGEGSTISVNVSARQLDSDTIIGHVERAIRSSGIAPDRLILEVTETTLLRNTDLTARRLHALKALGVRIAVDDFGTGYSSLAYLQQFPVDCLKIDRSFTDAITRSSASDAIAHTLVRLGKDLGLTTLAEGVETTGQLDYLRNMDVDQAQGFLFARPLPADAFNALADPSAENANVGTRH